MAEQNPPITVSPIPLPTLPTVAVVDSLVLKVALTLMAVSSLLLTGVVTLDHFAGSGSSPVVNPGPPIPVPQPLPPNPWPVPQPLPGPGPQPIPQPLPQPIPTPQPPLTSAPTLTVVQPGQTLVRVRVGDKTGFAAFTFDQPGTYPTKLEVVGDPAIDSPP